MEKAELKEHIILVDADYADGIAQGFIHHFSVRLGRELPAVDMPLWLVCCALDAQLPDNCSQIQVIFVYSFKKKGMQYFIPADFKYDLDGKAFRDPHLGEFLLSAVPEEEVNNGAPLINQCIQALVSDEKVKTLTVVASASACQLEHPEVLQHPNHAKATLISMGDVDVQGFESVNMGYGLMHALHINANELA